ncbi:MAG: DUF2007 domain-containing protein [Salinivirgaceae bacterium]|nr:DUF2007 domain-containing protein [Salinivirgaceae bacterium]
MKNSDWVIAFSTTQAYQAYIIKDLLEDHDIDAVVIDKQDSFYIMIGEIEVVVKADDVIRAKHLIKKANF